MVDAGSAETWPTEEQKHKGVRHVFTFTPNAFFFSCENHKFQLIDFFVYQKVNTLPVWFHVSARNTLNETFSTFFYQTAFMQPGILGSPFGKFLVETPLLQPFFLYFSCPFTSDFCHHPGAKADFKQAAGLLSSEYLVQYMLSC